LSAGHDVAEAALLFRSADDESVLAHAILQGRILITCDRDFGELVFLHGAPPPPAIIYIRFEPEDVADIIPRLNGALDFERLKDHMTVIGDETTRRRAFPRKISADA
jgi:predicted nuclease of predicted toxin-antitoxin system